MHADDLLMIHRAWLVHYMQIFAPITCAILRAVVSRWRPEKDTICGSSSVEVYDQVRALQLCSTRNCRYSFEFAITCCMRLYEAGVAESVKQPCCLQVGC